MPTPRHFQEIARQVRLRAAGGSSSSSSGSSAPVGEWLPGVVAAVVGGDLSKDVLVQLDAGGVASVAAVSVLDFPLEVDSRVWVVAGAGGGYLVVGVQ